MLKIRKRGTKYNITFSIWEKYVELKKLSFEEGLDNWR